MSTLASRTRPGFIDVEGQLYAALQPIKARLFLILCPRRRDTCTAPTFEMGCERNAYLTDFISGQN